MKVKTSELAGAALDWAVANAEGYFEEDLQIGKATAKIAVQDGPHGVVDMRHGTYFRPSTEWAQGGPIIEREGLAPQAELDENCKILGWSCCNWIGSGEYYEGETYLVAAMRCYVSSRLGDEVDVPEELQP